MPFFYAQPFSYSKKDFSYSIFEEKYAIFSSFYPSYAALPLLLFTMDKRHPNALLRARVLVRDKKIQNSPGKPVFILDKQMKI